MARYDRLVRFTIFRISRQRCRQDPHWVDSIASETWAGFVRSMQRDPNKTPDSVSRYLMRTARNRSISALRGVKPAHDSLEDGGEEEASLVAGQEEDPLERAARNREGQNRVGHGLRGRELGDHAASLGGNRESAVGKAWGRLARRPIRPQHRRDGPTDPRMKHGSAVP